AALPAARLKTVIDITSNLTGRFDPVGTPVRLIDACRAVKSAVFFPAQISDPAQPRLFTIPADVVPLNSTTPAGPSYSIFLEWSDASGGSCNPVVGYEVEIRSNGQRFAGTSTTSTSATQTITNPSSFSGWSLHV